jgi:F-type H+-transporting ATPase subunit b
MLQTIASALLLLAEAAEQAQEVPWYRDPRWRIVNLLIFVAILVYILVKRVRIGEVFDRRAAGIRQQLEEARRGKEEAELRLAEVEARLNRLDQEIAEIKAESERESVKEHDRIAMAASSDAEKIGQTAQREIAGAMKTAKSELRAFVAEQSVQLAESIIRKEMKPDDSKRLLNKYIDDLGEVKQ